MLRIISFCIIVLSIFLFPWWVGTVLAVGGVFYFTTYAEIIFFSILIDALYGHGMMMDRFIFTFVSVLIFLLAPIVKSKLYVRS